MESKKLKEKINQLKFENVEITKKNEALEVENKKLLNQEYDKTIYYRFDKDGEITKFYADLFSDMFLKKYDLISISGLIYAYKKGVYVDTYNIKNEIRKFLSRKDPSMVTNIKNALEVIEMKTAVRPNLVNCKDHLINFKNGLYNINTCQIEEHDKSFLSTVQINAEYDQSLVKSIKETRFLQFLKISGYSDILIDHCKQVIGYLLSNSIAAQKMFILRGRPHSGKSTFLKILSSFFEKKFVSNIDLKKLDKESYVATLFGKALNVCADISQNYIEDTSLILQILGEDLIQGKALYKNPFSFLNKAKFVFSTNLLPNVNDKTGAFMRRCEIIPFDNIVSEEKKDPDLADKIIDNELSVITSWGMEGFQELQRNNFRFISCDEINIELNNYKLANNNIEMFVKDYIKITNNNEHFITKGEFKYIYLSFCNQEGFKPLTVRNIDNYLKTDLKLKESRSYLANGRYYLGICFNKKIIGDIFENIEPQYKKEIKSTIYDIVGDEVNYKRAERIGIKKY